MEFDLLCKREVERVDPIRSPICSCHFKVKGAKVAALPAEGNVQVDADVAPGLHRSPRKRRRYGEVSFQHHFDFILR